MATTVEDLQRWQAEGERQGATHMIVVCDTFDWEDYPVYVMPGEDLDKKIAQYDGPNMQKIMEIVKLREKPKKKSKSKRKK